MCHDSSIEKFIINFASKKKQGYTGKMYLDQGWLTQQTSDSVFWRLTATFQNEVKEFKASYFVAVFFLLKNLISTLFKVWDADIINPNPGYGNKYVNNVTSVEVSNAIVSHLILSFNPLKL